MTSRPDTPPSAMTRDLFFSRTDGRGVIQTGNTVFQSISGFEWDELINAPHKIVRHGDMPKAVFQLLWDTIKAGNPAGAYVKNKTKTGGHYWVFAVMFPVTDGFLSVRLTPESPLFEKTRNLYEKIHKLEQEGGKTSEETARHLVSEIVAQGYTGYEDFMSKALFEEMRARDRRLGNAASQPAKSLIDGLDAWRDIAVHCVNILTAYNKIEATPRNLEIQAAQLGSGGHSLSEISVYFSRIASQMSHMLRAFNAASDEIAKMMNESLFLLEAARLQTEMQAQFVTEDIPATMLNIDQEAELFDHQVAREKKAALEHMESLSKQIDEFINVNKEVELSLTALDVARVMCQIETASITGFLASIEATINELDNFIRHSASEIHQINSLLSRVKTRTKSCLLFTQKGTEKIDLVA